jgi:hypothetical protein
MIEYRTPASLLDRALYLFLLGEAGFFGIIFFKLKGDSPTKKYWRLYLALIV